MSCSDAFFSSLRQSEKKFNDPLNMANIGSSDQSRKRHIYNILVFLTNTYVLAKAQIEPDMWGEYQAKLLVNILKTVPFLMRSLIVGSALICHFMPKWQVAMVFVFRMLCSCAQFEPGCKFALRCKFDLVEEAPLTS